jgi:hypothetical protein
LEEKNSGFAPEDSTLLGWDTPPIYRGMEKIQDFEQKGTILTNREERKIDAQGRRGHWFT